MSSTDILALSTVPPGGGRRRLFGLEFARRSGGGSEVMLVEKGPRLIGARTPRCPRRCARCWRRRGCGSGRGAECISFVPGGDRGACGSTAPAGRPRSSAATCCSPWAGHPTPATWGSRPPRSRPTGAGRSWWTSGSQRACRGFGCSASATGAAGSPIPPTTTTRSWRRTCSTAVTASSADRIPAYALLTDPPLGRCGMSEGEARAAGHRLLVGRRPMTRVSRAVEEGETRGFIKVVADADTGRPSVRRSSGSRATRSIHAVLDLMVAGAPRHDDARGPHPSDGGRAAADGLRRDGAGGVRAGARPSSALRSSRARDARGPAALWRRSPHARLGLQAWTWSPLLPIPPADFRGGPRGALAAPPRPPWHCPIG